MLGKVVLRVVGSSPAYVLSLLLSRFLQFSHDPKSIKPCKILVNPVYPSVYVAVKTIKKAKAYWLETGTAIFGNTGTFYPGEMWVSECL